MQQRLAKYSRNQDTYEAFKGYRFTPTSIKIIEKIHDYKFLPTSMLLRLVGGDRTNVYDHLKALYHLEYINRFAFSNPGQFTLGEFNYYLDDIKSLRKLQEARIKSKDDLDYAVVRRNKTKRYCDLNNPEARDVQERTLFLHHELDISRFHFMLEMACRESSGRVLLYDFKQGSELWRSVYVPKLTFNEGRGEWQETDQAERLPVRPDFFYTLYFAQRPEGDQFISFFYERDRGNTWSTRWKKRFRAYWYYVVKQKQIRTDFGLSRVRVLIESTTAHWTESLRRLAQDPAISPNPSPLFWFTP